ncbi:DUF3800 domain-containing protein [Paraburkholderia sp. DHOC27]|uniref:DUF3800 domain-containing protein n=1 Tax=Paraburkholderia sp. DHOC27 TaxID=2303330 RepID=UPI000E3EBFE0|nr:DUF3800 domain-containing protein [Paraburkholderia sp. DHOC27]RFU49366.1 DUF3800 domain-containing protein [Paraburkholderia sp. DHOC27]
MAATIYLDESGCLGWRLDQPYLRGGSSRFFTLAAAIIPDGNEPILNRVVRGMYKRRGRSTSNELKSVALKSGERERFANALGEIRRRHTDIQFATITVRKENVGIAFRRHPNGLYNYMVKCLLIDIMAQQDSVSFIPDARSIKTELRHSLHEYLVTELASLGDTFLQTTPWESKDCLPLQFVDILAGIVWSHYEFGNGAAYRAANPHIVQRRLFFGDLH